MILILLPDIGMLGYVINSNIGAFVYNIFHHKGIALGILIAGMYYQIESIELTGVILFAHSAMDRLFGYGLKYPDSFSNTHMGKIGKEK